MPDIRHASETVRRSVIRDDVSRRCHTVLTSFQTHLEFCLMNGDVVDGTIKGTKGRSSSAMTERPLKAEISHIRVIGREDRTNAELAQYRLLLQFLSDNRHVPLFVNLIWFPGNSQGSMRDGTITSSCGRGRSPQIPENLNDSQKRIVRAMVSTDPQHSLVIAHGILIILQLSFSRTNADMIAQGLLEQGKRPQSLQQHQYGYRINSRAG